MSDGEIAQDTIVSTGFKSTAVIVVGSTVIAVRPLTRLTLSEMQAAPGADSAGGTLTSLQTIGDFDLGIKY